MTSEFVVYLRLGFGHIADVGALDHILFVIALAAGYGLTHWRHLLILVTAFTVGHSITLALATLRLVSVSSALVELLIPLTILATAVFDLIEVGVSDAQVDLPVRMQRTKYGLALAFGLIHGLGFSTFLRAILGAEESILQPLLAFNVGLEVGQIVILGATLAVSHVVIDGVGMRSRLWTIILSGVVSLAALVLLAGRIAV
ncbi:MAG: HupE/UreJ family protein [Gemmatimonadota bacterium]|jgi:hypothetical protein